MEYPSACTDADVKLRAGGGSRSSPIYNPASGRAERAQCALLVLGFSFSATWWKFATDADAYIAAVFFLLSSYAVSQRHHRVPVAALLHAAAMLFHQLAVVYLPVALMLTSQGSRKARTGLRDIILYIAVAGGATLGPYWVAYNKLRPGSGFVEWLTSHSTDATFSFDIARNLGQFWVSSVRLVFGGKLNHAIIDGASVAVAIIMFVAGLGLVASLTACGKSIVKYFTLRSKSGRLVLWRWVDGNRNNRGYG